MIDELDEYFYEDTHASNWDLNRLASYVGELSHRDTLIYRMGRFHATQALINCWNLVKYPPSIQDSIIVITEDSVYMPASYSNSRYVDENLNEIKGAILWNYL